MVINFQQGIITYPVAGNAQAFLSVTGGYISLSTTNGRVDVAFSHGTSNYLLTEAADVPNAWGPITINTDTWLYWDLDTRTAIRTFGITTLQPQYGLSLPASAAQGQHYFVTTENKMYVYNNNSWRNVVRVFAAKYNTGVFTPLGSGFASKPFSGSQVGITTLGTVTGRILVDDTGKPVRRTDGRFFTTEDDIFVNGSPANTIRLEANVLTATALENMGRYQVVRFSQFGKINVATYYDLQNTTIAMLMEDLNVNETGTVITQGTVTNPSWNFSTVGALLWVDGSGVLTETDPHIADNVTYPTGKPPIGRVITPTTIIFDQGLGGKGDKGDKGDAGNLPMASTTVYGMSRLSVEAVNPAHPITVGDNDPRLTDARQPLSHTHPASVITFTPYLGLNVPNVQIALQSLYDGKVNRSGDTMTGFLTLNADPTSALHAASKQYVDSRSLNDLSDVQLLAPTSNQTLVYTGGVWTNGSIALNDLSDVNTSSVPPNTGDILSYTGAEWIPMSPNFNTLNGLSDVEATTYGENAWLHWNTSTNLWESSVGMPYDMHFFLPGKSSGIGNLVMGGMVVPRTITFPAIPSFPVKSAWCEVAPTTDVTFEIRINNQRWVAVTFNAGSNIGNISYVLAEYTAHATMVTGDVVKVVTVAENDTIEDVMIVLSGCTTELLCS